MEPKLFIPAITERSSIEVHALDLQRDHDFVTDSDGEESGGSRMARKGGGCRRRATSCQRKKTGVDAKAAMLGLTRIAGLLDISRLILMIREVLNKQSIDVP